MPGEPPISGDQPEQVIWMRPAPAPAGRPAQRSRAEITAAAIAIADCEGLDAVSMRRVAASLGTGAASLYRYLDTRADLLDLMADATAAEFSLSAPTGDWLADLLVVGYQARRMLRRHRWLASLSVSRPVLGPNGLVVLEHVLEVLAGHPAPLPAKFEAFAMLNGITALFVLQELAGGSAAQQRSVSYLQHAIAAGRRPRLGQLLAEAGPPQDGAADPADRYGDVMARLLRGVLG